MESIFEPSEILWTTSATYRNESVYYVNTSGNQTHNFHQIYLLKDCMSQKMLRIVNFRQLFLHELRVFIKIKKNPTIIKI